MIWFCLYGVDGVEVSFSLYWFRVLEDHFVYNVLTDSKQEKEKEKKKRKEKEGVELVKLETASASNAIKSKMTRQKLPRITKCWASIK